MGFALFLTVATYFNGLSLLYNRWRKVAYGLYALLSLPMFGLLVGGNLYFLVVIYEVGDAFVGIGLILIVVLLVVQTIRRAEYALLLLMGFTTTIIFSAVDVAYGLAKVVPDFYLAPIGSIGIASTVAYTTIKHIVSMVKSNKEAISQMIYEENRYSSTTQLLKDVVAGIEAIGEDLEQAVQSIISNADLMTSRFQEVVLLNNHLEEVSIAISSRLKTLLEDVESANNAIVNHLSLMKNFIIPLLPAEELKHAIYPYLRSIEETVGKLQKLHGMLKDQQISQELKQFTDNLIDFTNLFYDLIRNSHLKPDFSALDKVSSDLISKTETIIDALSDLENHKNNVNDIAGLLKEVISNIKAIKNEVEKFSNSSRLSLGEILSNFEKLSVPFTDVLQQTISDISALKEVVIDMTTSVSSMFNITSIVAESLGDLLRVSNQMAFLSLSSLQEIAKSRGEGEGFKEISTGLNVLASDISNTVNELMDLEDRILEHLHSIRSSTDNLTEGLNKIQKQIREYIFSGLKDTITTISSSIEKTVHKTSDVIGKLNAINEDFLSLKQEIKSLMERTTVNMNKGTYTDSKYVILDILSKLQMLKMAASNLVMVYKRYRQISDKLLTNIKVL